MIIPLEPRLPFFNFRVTLSGRPFRIFLHWSTRFSYYSVSIYEDGQPLIQGRGLHPDQNLFHGLNLNLGSLYLEGEPATPDNLGIGNELRYEE